MKEKYYRIPVFYFTIFERFYLDIRKCIQLNMIETIMILCHNYRLNKSIYYYIIFININLIV